MPPRDEFPPDDEPARENEPGTADDQPIAERAYDRLADDYDAQIDDNPYNTEMEFPGTTGLLADHEIEGNRILDAGCGTGLYTEWLLEQGAETVVGVDASEEMLAHAAERVADRVDQCGTDRADSQRPDRVQLHRADLAEPLAFADDGEFDGVVSALVLSYVEDWRPTLAEFARVLAPDGFLVFSVGHPIEYFCDDEGAENYFETERLTADWGVEVPFYRRPLSEMLNPLSDAGFRLDEIAEPRPTEAFREQRPDVYEKESKNPVFLCVRAVPG